MLKRAWLDIWQTFLQLPQLIYGLWRISRLHKPCITVFGGSRIRTDDRYYKEAKKLCGDLSLDGFSFITGGGSGIMEASLCGALDTTDWHHVLGIAVRGVDPTYHPKCHQATIHVSNFTIRKLLLVHYSSAIVIFPGGFGTLDELFHTLNLITTYQIASIPVIVFGKEFWKPLIDWIYQTPYHRNLITEHNIKVFTFVDSVDEARNLILKHQTPARMP